MQWKNSEQQLSLQMVLFLSKNEKNERHFVPFFIERWSWIDVTKKLECLYKT